MLAKKLWSIQLNTPQIMISSYTFLHKSNKKITRCIQNLLYLVLKYIIFYNNTHNLIFDDKKQLHIVICVYTRKSNDSKQCLVV